MGFQGSPQEIDLYKLGQKGTVDVIAEASGTWSGYWAMVKTLRATIFTNGTAIGGSTNPFGAATVEAGIEIPGRWTGIQLRSGSVIAYSYNQRT